MVFLINYWKYILLCLVFILSIVITALIFSNKSSDTLKLQKDQYEASMKLLSNRIDSLEKILQIQEKQQLGLESEDNTLNIQENTRVVYITKTIKPKYETQRIKLNSGTFVSTSRFVSNRLQQSK